MCPNSLLFLKGIVLGTNDHYPQKRIELNGQKSDHAYVMVIHITYTSFLVFTNAGLDGNRVEYLAVPNLRGRDEVMVKNGTMQYQNQKQMYLDDFIAAAEYWWPKIYCASDLFAIKRGSNAASLVGATNDQRPKI